MLQQRLAHVRERIQAACRRCGRAPDSVTLIGVTKTVGPDAIRDAVACGVTDLGENRVQEARVKQREINAWLGARGYGLGSVPPSPKPLALSPAQRIRWHLIGHLQRNKAKEAVRLFDVIHSVDSVALIEELEQHLSALSTPHTAHSTQKTLEVFIQVNVSGEATKFGCRPEEAAGLAAVVLGCAHLRLAGLMTIAPSVPDPEQVRPVFRQLRQLRDEVAGAFHLPPATFHLSMGMSQDFEIAIEEGADFVRVGTAIFEGREGVSE